MPQQVFPLAAKANSTADHKAKQVELNPIESHMDDSGNLMKLRQINAFPTWITTDASGKEIFRQAGGIQVPSESQMPQVVSFLLGR